MTMILGVWLAGTFAAAGTVRWIRGWICIAATLVMCGVNNFTPDKVADAHERTYQEVLHTKPMKERAQQQEAGSKSVMPG